MDIKLSIDINLKGDDDLVVLLKNVLKEVVKFTRQETLPTDGAGQVDSREVVSDQQAVPCYRCGEHFYPEDNGDIFCQECGELIDNAPLDKIEDVTGSHTSINAAATLHANKVASEANKVAPCAKSVKVGKTHIAAVKHCVVCKKEYTPKSNRQQKCTDCASPEVKYKRSLKAEKVANAPEPELSSNGRKVKTCPECQVKFEPSYKSQKYCSPFCSNESNKRMKIDWHRNTRRERMEASPGKKCLICEKMFIPTSNAQRLCSEACKKKAAAKYYDNWAYKKKTVIKAAAPLHPGTGRPVYNDPFN